MTSEFASGPNSTSSQDDDLSKPVIPNCELFELLGRGGMASVYRGIQTSLDREVAVKVMRRRFDDGQAQQQRFLREAQLSSKLNHPNIARIVSFGVDKGGANSYIIFEYLKGSTLAEHVSREGPLAWEICLKVFFDVCAALEYAHGQGIVHRDLKPGNIMLVSDSATGALTAKVLDFGIAKVIRDDDSGVFSQQITKTGALLGSPDYMSPEQCSGQIVDQRSDVYSLGCMLFYACSGKPPFVGNSAYEIMSSHLHNTIPDLGTANGVVDQLDSIVKTAMAKDPDERYQSVVLFKDALNGVKNGDFRKVTKATVKGGKIRSSRINRALVLTLIALASWSAFSFTSARHADAEMERQIAKVQKLFIERRWDKAFETLDDIPYEVLSRTSAVKLVNFKLDVARAATFFSDERRIDTLAKNAFMIADGNHLKHEAAQCKFFMAQYRGGEYRAGLYREAEELNLTDPDRHLILAAALYGDALANRNPSTPAHEAVDYFNRAVEELKQADTPECLWEVYAAYANYEKSRQRDDKKASALLADALTVLPLIKLDTLSSAIASLSIAELYLSLGDAKHAAEVARHAELTMARLKLIPDQRVRALNIVAAAEEGRGNPDKALASLRAITELKGLSDPVLKTTAYNDLAQCLIRNNKYEDSLVAAERGLGFVDRILSRPKTPEVLRWRVVTQKTQLMISKLTALLFLQRSDEFAKYNKRALSELTLHLEQLQQYLGKTKGSGNGDIYSVTYPELVQAIGNCTISASGKKEAEHFVSDAIRFAEKQSMNEASQLSLLMKKAAVLMNIQGPIGALAPLEKAMDIQKRTRASHASMAITGMSLGAAYISSGQVAKGVKLCEEYLPEVNNNKGWDVQWASNVLPLADAYAMRGDYSAARSLYDRFLHLTQKGTTAYTRSDSLYKTCLQAL